MTKDRSQLVALAENIREKYPQLAVTIYTMVHKIDERGRVVSYRYRVSFSAPEHVPRAFPTGFLSYQAALSLVALFHDLLDSGIIRPCEAVSQP